MKRTELGAGAKSIGRGSTFESRGNGLARKPGKPRRTSFTPASTAQRAKIAGQDCIVLSTPESPCGGPITPAHVVDRALGGDDDPRCVVPLCVNHHRAYDQGGLSILEHMEPRYRVEQAYAVELVGLLLALHQITGERYVPVGSPLLENEELGERLRAKLAAMRLHDDLPDSYDIGFMAAWREINDFLQDETT
jgi:hypothetical protein